MSKELSTEQRKDSHIIHVAKGIGFQCRTCDGLKEKKKAVCQAVAVLYVGVPTWE